MDADLYYPESELGGFEEWSGPRIGLKPDLDYPTDTKWQDGPDDPFRVIRGVMFGVCLSLPLWGVIIGAGMFLFRV